MKRVSIIIAIAVLVVLLASVYAFRPVLASRATVQDDTGNSEPKAPNDVQEASAASSPVFSYQGQLTDASGNPITNAAMPMTFSLFSVSTGGTACWTENQTVNVQNGQFNVLLGQINAIPTSCLISTVYLELVINSEALSPREQLTAVASAVQANTLVADALTQGPLTVQGDITLDDIIGQPGNANLEIENLSGNIRLKSAKDVYMFLDGDDNDVDSAQFIIYRNSSNVGGNVATVLTLNESGAMKLEGGFTADSVTINSGGGADDFKIGSGNGNTVLRRDGNRVLHLVPWGGSSSYKWDSVCIGCASGNVDLLINGNLSVTGTCSLTANGTYASESGESCMGGSITSAAYIEANLLTPEELAAEVIERFGLGDLLCWSADDQQLELCEQTNDRLVMAVANGAGKPIVLGAEPVKVIGPVVAGDLLVASDVPGHAMVNNNPLPGTVIGQALEDLDGESGIIKAMIRKW